MSKRTAEADTAIREAWMKERTLVQEGKGTREWTPQQQQEILEKGKAYDDDGVAFQGQHMKSVEKYPECQGESGNIQFLTRAEHLEAHDGNWRNPTNWYYNPITKEKITFGEGPFIPCEIIQLPDPIVKLQMEQTPEEACAKEFSQEVRNKEEMPLTAESSQAYVHSKGTAKQDASRVGFGKKLTNKLSEAVSAVIEFSARHPVATKVIKEVGVFAATVAVAAIAESSKNESSESEQGPFGNEKTDDNNYEISSDTCDDSPVDDIQPVISDRGYTPNDVPAGKQRYHYKDGRVDWVEKPPYHRGGDTPE